MSIDSVLNSAKTLTNELNSGTNVFASLGSDLNALSGGSSTKAAAVKVAKLRGVPFVMLENDGHFGRRQVVHEYPFSDDVWAEDLGRTPRRISVRGYVVSDNGQNNVVAKRDQLIKAAEQDGLATFSHPTYGELQGGLAGPLTVQERWDKQRMFDISFTFLQSRLQEYPSSDTSTGSTTDDAADTADVSAAASFAQTAASALKAGASAVAAAVGQAATWVNTAQRLANDATNLKNLVKQLPGDFGRFVGEVSSLSGSSGSTPGATVNDLVAQASVSRQTVASAGATLTAAASALSPTTTDAFSTAAQAQAAAILAVVNDPADGIRMLQTLAQPVAQTAAPSSPIGQSITAIQRATSDLFRRAAVVALARASALYQPASTDDAAAVRATVTTALDAEIQIAADQFEDAVYSALRAVRAAASADLTARGAGLPTTRTVTTKLPMPALVLAQKVYRDASYADAMVAQANPIHPLFMPTRFKVIGV